LEDIINVMNSYEVTPHELEQIITSEINISDVAVMGMESSAGNGERPKALVVRQSIDDTDEEEIKTRVASIVMRYKQLTHVEFVKCIPRNEYGKVLRKELKNLPTTASNFYWQD